MMKNQNRSRLHPLSVALLSLIYPTVWAVEADDNKATDAEKITIVSAQKRNESIQDVPIAMNAFSDDGVRNLGASNINDLGQFTPGMEANNTSVTQPTYKIRGIGTTDFGIGSDPAVAVYIDGVYVGRSGAAQLNFNDIERVEILKGPQGTLFGRNAGAGAIHIITKAPVDMNENALRFTVRENAQFQLEGSTNISNGDNLHARISLLKNHRDGWAERADSDKQLGEENNQGFRTSVLWNVGDNTDLTFRADGDRVDQDAEFGATTNPYLSAAGGDPYGAIETDLDSREYRNLLGGSVEVKHRMGDMEFYSLTANRHFQTQNLREDDGTANYRFELATDNREELDSLSQEFRLTGSSENSHWSLGAMWSNEKIKQTTNVNATTDTIDTFFLYEGITAQAMGMGMSEEDARAFAQAQLPVDGSSALVGAGLGGVYYSMGGAASQFLFNSIAGQINSAAGTAFSGTDVATMYGRQNLGRDWVETTVDEGDFTSAAIYFDYTWSVSDALDITVGARYTKDDKTFRVDSAYQNAFDFSGGATAQSWLNLPNLAPYLGTDQIPFGLVFYEPIPNIKNDDSWTDVSPRLVVDYQWNDNVMTYFSAAKGFKAGGFNTLGADVPNNRLEAVDPEEIFNYEAGLKSSWLDKSLTLNLALYQYDYEGFQLVKLTGPAGAVPTYNIGNADAKGKGYEIEMNWQVNDNFALHMNYSGIDTEITKYDYTQFEGETAADDITGNELSNMPDKYNVGFSVNGDVADGNVMWYTNMTHIDSSTEISGLSPITIGGYDLVNTRISYRPHDGAMEFAFEIHNATDEQYLYGLGGEGEALGTPFARRGKPRQMQASVAFFF